MLNMNTIRILKHFLRKFHPSKTFKELNPVYHIGNPIYFFTFLPIESVCLVARQPQDIIILQFNVYK